MVVCPCGVMVPAAGVGRARRGLRAPTGCFDTTATVTTQPREPQDTPASVEKLAAAAAATADPSGIPRPLSRTSKNKGGSTSKISDEIKGDLSRTTLALATTESGRYVGTRPLRSNRSPTPTLHRLPQKTSRDHSANGGRPTKHLPAVRTSPTSPLDNQGTGASRGSKLKGPTALPRNNSLNHRMNDLNSNQRRLLTQYVSPDEKHLSPDEKHLSLSKRQPRSIPSSANPATKTFNNDTATSSYQRIYENFPQIHTANDSTIYENTGRVLHTQPPPPPQGFCDDVTARKMDSSADTLTSEEPMVTSEESTVWLSDSWKYNTIKKAPEFNIFEFLDLDLQSETEKDENKKRRTKEISNNKKEETERKREIRVDKVKKKIRSRLPMFGWKSDKENKGNAESAIKTFQTPEQQVLKPDNKWTQKTPDVVTSPVSIHRSQIEKPLTDNAYLSSTGSREKDSRMKFSREKDSRIKLSREKDPNFCPPEIGRDGIVKSPITYRIKKRYTYMQDHERSRSPKNPVAKSPTKVTTEPEPTAIERHRCDNVSSSSTSSSSSSSWGGDTPLSCGSPLISPGSSSLSLRPSQMPHAPRNSQLPSPTPSRRQVSPKTHGRASSFEKVPGGHSPSSTSSPPYPLPSPSSSISSSTSLRYLENPNEEIFQDEQERSRMSSSSSSSSSARPLNKSQGDKFSSRMHKHSPLPPSHLTEREGNDTMNKQTNKPTNIRLPQILPSKRELKSGSRFTAQCLKSTNMRLQEGVSSEPSYRTTSTREGRRKRNMVEEEKEEKEEEEEREARTSSPPPFSPASSCMSQETKGAAGPPGSCRDMKVKRWKQNVSRGSASREDWKENTPSRYPAKPLPPPTPYLPSPTLSCPPFVDERRNIIPTQYHSLPQLHSDTRDGSPRHHSPRRDNRTNPASFQPYYMGDLNKISSYEASRSRRYSQTSLIDQALESLEFSSPSSYTSEELNTYSNMSPITKRYSQLVSGHHIRDGNLQMPSSDTRQVKMSESPSRDCPWESTSTRSAMSPVLPPLPAGVLDDHSPPSSQKQENKSDSPESPTKLASICILSLDLTVDCEEFSGNGFNLVSIKNDTQCDQGTAEGKPKNEDKMPLFADEELSTVNYNDGVESKDEDTVSVKSLSIDEKYYENDDYDSIEESSCDFLSEEQQRQLDESIALLSEQRDDEGYDNLASEREAKNVIDNDDEDSDEITCGVQPMEALKRPLVYGYGSGPVRNLQGPSFLEKRLSQASDMSEYLEIDLAEALCKAGTTEVRKKSESCMNLRETYWDYWQAKKGAGGSSAYQSSSSGNSSRTCSPGFTNCPSERFCYDPEVLLAHVRCPKSLEDATFKQYSAYVKSHIYDYFGNVNDALNDSGLSNVHRDWICSQPELLPNASSHCPKARNPPLDYSSEPELSNGGGRESPYGISPYQYAMRAPPPLLHSKDSSQDSGTWTYLQSPQGPAPGFSTRGAYPVPLPRSTSSLSHVGPGTYNPWYHLLPDVTPPRTPRHSMYYTSTTPVSASPSPSRGSLTSLTSALETTKASPMAHHTSKHVPKPAPTQTTSHTFSRAPSKRSFLPNFSKVVRSPLRKSVFRSKTQEVEDSMDVVPELPTVHPSIQNRTHTTTSSKSSSSSSSSSSASSKDSVTTVIPATARNKSPNWLMRHFGGSRSKMTAV